MIVPDNIYSSEFRCLDDIEYFEFEEDFVEANIRCIPMIVRYKMDITGIKLKLSEWSKFDVAERQKLARMSTESQTDIKNYFFFLTNLVRYYTSKDPTLIQIEQYPEWLMIEAVPSLIQEQAQKYQLIVSLSKWRSLTILQRFALLKLARPGHENKNFTKAMREFKLSC